MLVDAFESSEIANKILTKAFVSERWHQSRFIGRHFVGLTLAANHYSLQTTLFGAVLCTWHRQQIEYVDTAHLLIKYSHVHGSCLVEKKMIRFITFGNIDRLF